MKNNFYYYRYNNLISIIILPTIPKSNYVHRTFNVPNYIRL